MSYKDSVLVTLLGMEFKPALQNSPLEHFPAHALTNTSIFGID